MHATTAQVQVQPQVEPPIAAVPSAPFWDIVAIAILLKIVLNFLAKDEKPQS